MAAGRNRIAQQLTRWIGGTILLLMLVFVFVDLGLQIRSVRRYHEEMAARGAEGLRQFFMGREAGEDPGRLFSGSDCLTYVQGRRAGFVVFDLDGNAIYASPLALSRSRWKIETLFSKPPLGGVRFLHTSISETPVVAAAERFQTRDEPPWEGVVVYLVNASDLRQAAVFLWSWRAVIILAIAVGVMLAVRIPVKKFIIEPLDSFFVGAYAASKDDYRGLPPCPVDNEFADVYDMFNRLMAHLEDTRIFEATLIDEEEAPPQPPPGPESEAADE